MTVAGPPSAIGCPLFCLPAIRSVCVSSFLPSTNTQGTWISSSRGSFAPARGRDGYQVPPDVWCELQFPGPHCWLPTAHRTKCRALCITCKTLSSRSSPAFPGGHPTSSTEASGVGPSPGLQHLPPPLLQMPSPPAAALLCGLSSPLNVPCPLWA